MERRKRIQGNIVFALGMGLVGIAIQMEEEGIRICILFFKRSLIRLEPTIRRKKKLEREEKAEPISEKPSKTLGEKGRRKRSYRGIWTKTQAVKALFEQYADPLFRCLRTIFRAFHLRDLVLHFEVGLNDPAHTGFLAGWASALRPLTGRRVRLGLTPNFREPCLRGTARLRLYIGLHRIAWALLRLIVDITPGLVRTYLLPKLNWPKRTPLAMARSEA